MLVIATGASNGFWRHDRVEDLGAIEADLVTVAAALDAAATVAVVGGGATGVSVADNLARRGNAGIHLFHSGDLPLPGYHPKVRRWIAGVLRDDGVEVHPGHRAVLPEGFTGDRLTTEPVAWSSGQTPFEPDCTLWAVGGVRPHSGFLPAELLDDDGFVRVDEHLQVPGHPNVFAVGDVAASDPHHSSARNWGYRVVVANVQATLQGRDRRLKRYHAPEYRWGSILGLQEDGLVVVQPDGRRVRVPRWAAEPLLYRLFVTRVLYGGLRRRRAEPEHVTAPSSAEPGVDLYWIPLGAGAGGAVVRWSGRRYEALAARVSHRDRSDLFHSALLVRVDGSQFAIEMAPVWTKSGDRGVISEGPVGLRPLGRSRLFRYEVRCWPGGSIPDAGDAVGGAIEVAGNAETARTILDLVPRFPTGTWGRDELGAGEMWNSNSLVSWLLASAGVEMEGIGPPTGGRAPGWDAGLVAAGRAEPATPPRTS